MEGIEEDRMGDMEDTSEGGVDFSLYPSSCTAFCTHQGC